MAESGVLADRPMKLVNESRDLLEKSRLNANQYRYQVALKLAELARNRAVTAEQQVRTIRAIKETVERRLEMLARLMERARERVQQSNDERARQQLRFAEEQYDRSLALLRDGKYHAARVMMEKVEKTLRSLIRQFSSRARPDPETMLDEAYALLERAVQMTSDAKENGGSPRSQEMIEQARNLLYKADESIAAGRPEEARRFIERARNMLRRAIAEGREQPDDNAIASMIENLERHREEVLSTFGDCEAPGIQTLVGRADARLANAKSKLAEGDLRSAEAEARIARNLYNRIREVCSM
jgi:nucleotide-binding universal stress UspA family protein